MKLTSTRIDLNRVGGMIGIDTMFVLFFLALEYGRAVKALSLDGLLMGTTMLMVLVLPYFLPANYDKPAFGSWLMGRGAVVLVGVLAGFGFNQSIGVVLPESVRFMPMTFLILASMISCYIQFYGLLRLRLAK